MTLPGNYKTPAQQYFAMTQNNNTKKHSYSIILLLTSSLKRHILIEVQLPTGARRISNQVN